MKILRNFSLSVAALAASAKIYEEWTDSQIITRTFRAVRCGLSIVYTYKEVYNESNILEVN